MLPLRVPGPTLVLALLAVGPALPVPARAAPVPAEYFSRSWLVDDGLPHNVVNRVVQDRQGYLWLATADGLTRFDGQRFREFPLPDVSLDAGANMRALATEDDGTLVMLPASGGVMRLRAGRFSPHPASAWVAGQSLVELFPAPAGVLWLGLADGGLVRWSGGQAVTFGREAGIDRHGAAFSFAVDGDGHTWIAGGDFLVRDDNSRLVPFPEKVGPNILIAPARSGGLWISTRDHLVKWERGPMTTFTLAPIWPSEESAIQQLYEDRAGTLWIVTRRHGLYTFSGGRLAHQETPSQMLSSVLEDAEGDLWVTANGGGLTELRRKSFVSLDTAAGLPDGTSSSVCVDAAGTVWCADRGGGVVRYAEGRANLVPGPRQAEPFYVNAVCPGADGDVWVGAFSGLYHIAAGRPTRIEPVDPLLRDIHLLFLSRRRDLWIVAGDRLGYLRAGTYHPVTKAEGFTGRVPSAMAEDAAGTVWLAVERELFSSTDGHLVRRVAREAFPGGRIHALQIDGRDNLWIGTAHGLVLMRGGRLRCFLQADGLADDLITQVLPDGRGELWLGGRRGLFHVATADLLALADGRLSAVSSSPYGTDEGLVGAAPISVCQPAVWRGPDGWLWFATYKGVVGLDPAKSAMNRPAPPVYLDEIRVDGRDRPPGPDLRLAPGDRAVTFLFGGPSFIAPEKVQLRHQLVGHDPDWIASGSERQAHYAQLPPGRYALQVAARHADGAWGPAETVQAITVLPAWWQRGGARAAMAALAALPVLLLARYGAQRKLRRRLERLEQAHALDKERARIARDLHDELGAGLTQIGMLAHRLKRRSREPEIGPALGQLAAKTRRLAGELEGIVWTMSPKNDSLDRFAAYLVRFAHDFFQDSTIACVVRRPELIPPCGFAPGVQHHLLAVVKEALANALKYSGATQVTLTLGYGQGVFSVGIVDNGAGFAAASAESDECNGLRNMRARIQEIGGQLQIESAPRRGTSILVQVRATPLPRPVASVAY